MKRTFKEVLAEELTVKSLRLSYPFPQAFSESPWLPTSLFILHRLVLTSCCAFLLIESVYKNPDYIWLLLFPNIAVVMTTLYFVVSTANCIYCAARDHARTRNKQSRENTNLVSEPAEDYLSLIPQPDIGDSDLETSAFNPPDLESDGLWWPHKIQWICFNVAANAIIAGSLIYVTCNEIIDELDVGMFSSLSAFMLADTLISFVPVRLLHFVYSFMFTALYVLVTAVFLAVDNPQDKDVIWLFSSFHSPTKVIVASVVILAQPIFHAIYFGLYKLRWYLVAMIYNRDEGL